MITTHVLDLTRGHPAVSVGVALERRAAGGDWERLGAATTNAETMMSAVSATPTRFQSSVSVTPGRIASSGSSR